MHLPHSKVALSGVHKLSSMSVKWGGEDPPPSLGTERAKYAIYWGRVPQTALPGGRNAPISPLGAGGPKTLLPQLQKAVYFGPAPTMKPPEPPGHT